MATSHTKRCEGCGNPFETGDAKTRICPTCRKLKYKYKVRINKEPEDEREPEDLAPWLFD